MTMHKIVLEIEGDYNSINEFTNSFIGMASIASRDKIKNVKRVSETCRVCGIMLKSEEIVPSCLLGFVCPQCRDNSHKPSKKKKP